MTDLIRTDICVIGGGSGGLSVAAGAAQMGADVILVEGGKMGGDCLNTGCVPSKALLAAAHRAVAPRDNALFGLSGGKPKADFGKVMAHVADIIAGIEPHDSVERFAGLGVRTVQEYGRFIDRRTLRVGKNRIRAKRFVIATGSAAALPPVKGLKNVPYLTNETLFTLKRQPKHLLILGGGPIGVEMAQAFARLGSQVTLIEAGRLLGREDPELVAHLRDRLIADGVTIREHAAVTAATAKGRGAGTQISLSLGEETVTGNALLVAAGRAPSVDGLQLDKAGVMLSDTTHPHIVVDKRLRTANKKIYAVGDVAGGGAIHPCGRLSCRHRAAQSLVLHAGQGRLYGVAARHLCGAGAGDRRADRGRGADAKYAAVKVLRWPFADNDRARAERDTQGMVKIVTTRNGRIVGASIVGSGAGDLLAPWTLALAQGLPVSAMAGVIAPYPTRGEAGKRAAGDYYTPSLFSPRTRKIVKLLSWFRS